MIAAVSAVLPASLAARTRSPRPAGTASKTGWAFQPMPNLNRQTRQAIGKAKAGWTFTTICTELGYACHKGRATWDQQRLGIGLRALARESGQDVRKVRRDCEALAELGLVVVHRPRIMHVADPDTGRIVTKAKGRCEAATIYLTITEAVLRPPKGHGGAMGGTTVEPPRAACKGHHGTTVREEKKQRTPDGDAVGIGTPPASQDAGLPAGEAGRLPAATHEEPTILPMDAGRDEPAIPVGRILPSAPAPRSCTRSEPRRRVAGFPEDRVEPQEFKGKDADRFAATRRRLEAEAAAREAAEAAWKQRFREEQDAARTPPKADPPPPRSSTPFDQEAAKAAALAALGKAVS